MRIKQIFQDIEKVEELIDRHVKVYITEEKHLVDIKPGDYLLHLWWTFEEWGEALVNESVSHKELFLVTKVSRPKNMRSSRLNHLPVVDLYWLNPRGYTHSHSNRAEHVSQLEWATYLNESKARTENWFKLVDPTVHKS